MNKISIELCTLDGIRKQYDQFGLDEIYKLVEKEIEKGGTVEITMEYTNAPKEVLRTISTLEEAKKLFRQE